MKKLIAIVIILIFICESAGYGLDSLRKPLDFNSGRGSEYFCRMLAHSIGVSMKKQMANNIRDNRKGALTIGEVNYTDISQGSATAGMVEKVLGDKLYKETMAIGIFQRV